jgi:hypothetical protein
VVLHAGVLARGLAVAGMAGAAGAVALIGGLHLVPPSAHVDPYRRTISQYALLETGWVFNVGVLMLAAGSVATVAALVGARLVPLASGGVLALLLWSVGLAAVVYFPKHNWSVGPSAHGTVHRIAGVVAFLSLPVAALLLGRLWRAHPSWGRYALRSTALGLLSLLCFAPIGLAFVFAPVLGVPWWRAIPLGAVERALALTEVVTVFTLAWWAARASGGRAGAASGGAEVTGRPRTTTPT